MFCDGQLVKSVGVDVIWQRRVDESAPPLGRDDVK